VSSNTDPVYRMEGERRSKPRISEKFAAKAKGVDVNGKQFSVPCTVENISASGVYLKCEEALVPGSELKLQVHFFVEGDTGSTIEARGPVVRIEPLIDGSVGLAIEISQHRFL
jgi:hypothetical protein